MTTSLRLIALALLISPSAHGALSFNIDGIGPDATPVASGGAVAPGDIDGVVNAAYSQTTLDGSSSGTMTITLTSLTLDGNGADDDTAVLNFTVSSNGGTINHSTDLGVNGNGAGRISATTESLVFTYTSGLITLGAGAAPGDFGTIDFLGFNQVDFSQFDNSDGDIATVQSGAGTPVLVTTDPYTFPSADPGALTVGYNAGGTSNDGFKVNHFRARFTLDVVPEPSTSLLSMMGLAGLLLRRRR